MPKEREKHRATSSADGLPAPRSTDSLEDFANLLACVLSDRSAVYVSTPITTGWRFMKWYAGQGRHLASHSDEYDAEHQRQVIQPNREDARRVIADLRSRRDSVVIDPTPLERSHWNQDDFRYFWGRIIERFAKRVLFLDGWHYSSGCAYEFLIATRNAAEIVAVDGRSLTRETGLELINQAIAEMTRLDMRGKVAPLEAVARELRMDESRHERVTAGDTVRVGVHSEHGSHTHKDEILNQLASTGNVAQFVSFGPHLDLPQRHVRIHDYEPGHRFKDARAAVVALLEHAPDGRVNVRAFAPSQVGLPFTWGLRTVDDVLATLRSRASEGAYTIVNETVDTHDGGVSGAAHGDVIEFVPKDTPRAVGRPGVCALPREAGMRLLECVYGFRPALAFAPEIPVEFSIHPRKRGLRQQHTIIWELAPRTRIDNSPIVVWPNHFSRFLGDKTFGLLVAHSFGLPVPRTTVVAREVAPFEFGRQTGTQEKWMRTCPEVSEPGVYPTTFGWTDPFEILQSIDRAREMDARHTRVAAVLGQEGVAALYSGSLVPDAQMAPVIEGVRGRGDPFMVGRAGPEPLPGDVLRKVVLLYEEMVKRLGQPCELEWAFDGDIVWVLQLRPAKVEVPPPIIKGDVYRFDTSLGLSALDAAIDAALAAKRQLILMGDVGLTSHFGQRLRERGMQVIIERPAAAHMDQGTLRFPRVG